MSTVTFPNEQAKQIFLDAQTKLTQVSRQIGKLVQQNASSEREQQHSAMTLNELNHYTDSTTAYKSVGKIFMRQDLAGMKGDLIQKMDTLKKESSSYERAAEKLKRDHADTQDLIKDLMAAATRN